jgi:transcription-repair coupling factor (superfamily II helicase)
MDLPKLHPGKRYTLPRPVGSADALLLAQLGEREKSAKRLTAIVTADATDAQRLIDEMAFFAPNLRCALFPDWETLPYDAFSPHQDLISERLATLWRIQQRDKDTGADVVIVPATTALYRLAPPSFPGRLHLSLQNQAKAQRGQVQSPIDAGRLQPCDPGGEPWRIRGARRLD